MAAKNFIELVEKTMRILEALAGSEEKTTLSTIAARVGMVKSSVFRLLFTLTQLGYVEKSESGSYVLSPKFLALSQTSAQRPSLTRISRPRLAEVCQKVQESAWLAEWRNGSVVMIDAVEARHSLQLSLNVGDLCPLHASALGKAIAAHLTPAELDFVLGPGKLPRYTGRTISTRRELVSQLSSVRRYGFSMNDGETIDGALVVGAPVFDSAGTAFAGISVTAPTVRCSAAKRKTMIAEVKRAAAAISQDLANFRYVAAFRLSNTENRKTYGG